MEKSSGALLNVDVTKFLGPDDMEETVSMLQDEREGDELVLFKMLEEGLNADVVLTAQGGSVKAHRSVLSATSPVFRAMFQQDMKEQLSSTVDIPDMTIEGLHMKEQLSSTVDIPDMTIEGLQLFLLVLYTTNEHIIGNSDDHYVVEQESLPWLFCEGIDKYFNEFFRALTKYQAFRRRLKDLLVAALSRNLTPHNCWESYDISLQFSSLQFHSDEIQMTVRGYIIDNFQDVLQTKECLSEMRRNPDRVHSFMERGIHSIKRQTISKHIESQCKKARRD